MNLKGNSNINILNKKKRSKEKSNVINHDIKRLEFYEKLVLTIKSVILQSDKNVESVLIIGENLYDLYKSLENLFSNIQYVISDQSYDNISQFKKRLESDALIHTKTLDIFNGSSLTDFYLEFGKFDLIILSGLFRKFGINDKKGLNSILFLYKHFLNLNGFFIILDIKEKISQELINLLKEVRHFKKIVKSYQRKALSLQYLIFNKKTRFKIFGG